MHVITVGMISTCLLPAVVDKTDLEVSFLVADVASVLNSPKYSDIKYSDVWLGSGATGIVLSKEVDIHIHSNRVWFERGRMQLKTVHEVFRRYAGAKHVPEVDRQFRDMDKRIRELLSEPDIKQVKIQRKSDLGTFQLRASFGTFSPDIVRNQRGTDGRENELVILEASLTLAR